MADATLADCVRKHHMPADASDEVAARIVQAYRRAKPVLQSRPPLAQMAIPAMLGWHVATGNGSPNQENAYEAGLQGEGLKYTEGRAGDGRHGTGKGKDKGNGQTAFCRSARRRVGVTNHRGPHSAAGWIRSLNTSSLCPPGGWRRAMRTSLVPP